jgi:hypothetical protein
LAIAAIRSELTSPKDRSCTVTITPGETASSTRVTSAAACSGVIAGSASGGGAESNDTLGLYMTYDNEYVEKNATKPNIRDVAKRWIELLGIYKIKINNDGFWLDNFKSAPKHIELRTAPLIKSQTLDMAKQDVLDGFLPVDPTCKKDISSGNKLSSQCNEELNKAAKEKNMSPVIRARSALGILKSLVGDLSRSTIEFVSSSTYNTITASKKNAMVNKGICNNRSYYDINNSNQIKLIDYDDCLNSILRDVNVTEADVSNERRYILIKEAYATSSPPQSDVYVRYFDKFKNMWYYIDKNDDISRINFNLIAQFLTMQAVAPAASPVTPTISVGGRGG